MELRDFLIFQRKVEDQARCIAEQFTKDQKALMSYFVNSDNESLCMSEVSGIFPEHSERNKTLVELVSFGLLIETQNDNRKAFKKGKYFSFFENHFRR